MGKFASPFPQTQTTSVPLASAAVPFPAKPAAAVPRGYVTIPAPIVVAPPRVRVYSIEFLLHFSSTTPPNEELKGHFMPKHPCFRIYNGGCKYGDKCHFADLRIDTCWQCLHGDPHEICEGPKPPTHPCIRVWGSCRYADTCRYRVVPRPWCLLCLRGSEHTTCSGVKPKTIPGGLQDYVHGPGRIEDRSRPPQYAHGRRQAVPAPLHDTAPRVPAAVLPAPISPSVSPAISPVAPPSPSAFVSPFKKQETPEAIALKAVRSSLNKITPEKFDKLATQIEEAMGPFLEPHPEKTNVVQEAAKQVFEKALAEPHMVSVYAKLANILVMQIAKYHAEASKAFRRYLISACQEQFSVPPPAADDEHATKHRERCQVNVTFIGQLYLQKCLTGRVVQGIIADLLAPHINVNYSDQVELLCLLIKTVGSKLEDQYLASVFKRLTETSASLEARVQFAVADVIELYQNSWVPRKEKLVPVTLAEVQAKSR